MTTGGNLPRGPTGWAGARCARSRQSLHRTRYSGGTGNSSRASGPTPGPEHAVAASSLRSAGWSFESRTRIRRRATRGSKARSRISGTMSDAQRLPGSCGRKGSRSCRNARPRGRRSCARTGVPSPARTSSRPKCERGVAWSPSTRSLSSTWLRGECRSSGRR